MLSKISSLILAIILLIVAVPIATADISGLTANPSSLSFSVLQNEAKSFEINFTSSSDITLSFSALEISDNDDDIIDIATPSDLSLLASETKSASFIIDVDGSVDIGSYDGIITVTDTLTLSTIEIPLTIQVTPGVCDFGPIGSSLKLDIEEPGSSDDFSPGDIIDIEVKVDNDGTENIRIQVEAFLFNEDDIIESAATQDENIEDGEDQTFKFSMTIPALNTDIDEDEDFTLFVKAYDEDDESNECIQDSVSLDIKLEKHNVAIEDSTRFLPEVISCGGEASLIVDVINLGEEDEDVKIQVENKELGILKTSDTFDLENFNSDEDNEATRTFDFDIPEGIQEKVYNFVVKVLYSGESESITLPLEVVSCGEFDYFPSDSSFTSASLAIQGNKLIKLSEKDTTLIHALVENNSPEKKIIFVSLADISEFAEGSSQTITLNAFQSGNVFLPLTVLSNVEEGTYSATVEASEGAKTLASDTVTIKVEGSQTALNTKEGSFIKNLSAAQLMALNIALLAIVLVIIYLLKRI